MTTFGFQLGIRDFWTLLTDWRNGSFAILLALGVLLVSYALGPVVKSWRVRVPTPKGQGHRGGRHWDA
jgi:hypothetical protein